MEISVNPQLKQFFLCYSGVKDWVPCYGHEIRVGLFSFCIVLLNSGEKSVINISEISSGLKIFEIPSFAIIQLLKNNMSTMLLFYEEIIGAELVNIIETNPDFESKILEARKLSRKLYGPMPAIVNVVNLMDINNKMLLN